MKLRPIIALGLAACALSLCGCFERVAGGTIETTNGITARVVLPTGNPATAIKVFLLDEQDWLEKTKAGESIVVDSAETNTEGEFTFKTVDTTRTTSLYVDVESYGILIHAVTKKLIKEAYNGKIGLAKKVSFQGTIKDPSFVAEKIFLAGSPFAAAVDSNGKFIIKDIPQEKYSVVILRRLPDQTQEYVVSDDVKLDEWTEGKPATIVTDTVKAFMLENFEDLDNRNLIGSVFGGGWWEANDDRQISNGNSQLLQPADASTGNFGRAIKDGGSTERAHSLQVLYTNGTRLGQNEGIPYVLLASNLGSYGAHYNLSKMD
jgi:hypothetical protein